MAIAQSDWVHHLDGLTGLGWEHVGQEAGSYYVTNPILPSDDAYGLSCSDASHAARGASESARLLTIPAAQHFFLGTTECGCGCDCMESRHADTRQQGLQAEADERLGKQRQ